MDPQVDVGAIFRCQIHVQLVLKPPRRNFRVFYYFSKKIGLFKALAVHPKIFFQKIASRMKILYLPKLEIV